MGAPLPADPPCILQRRLPHTAGDRHGLPLRVRAPQRGVRCIGNCSGGISFLLRFFAVHFRRVHDTDDSPTAGVDVDVLDRDLLLALAAVAIERIERDDPDQPSVLAVAPRPRLVARKAWRLAAE